MRVHRIRTWTLSAHQDLYFFWFIKILCQSNWFLTGPVSFFDKFTSFNVWSMLSVMSIQLKLRVSRSLIKFITRLFEPVAIVLVDYINGRNFLKRTNDSLRRNLIRLVLYHRLLKREFVINSLRSLFFSVQNWWNTVELRIVWFLILRYVHNEHPLVIFDWHIRDNICRCDRFLCEQRLFKFTLLP